MDAKTRLDDILNDLEQSAGSLAQMKNLQERMATIEKQMEGFVDDSAAVMGSLSTQQVASAQKRLLSHIQQTEQSITELIGLMNNGPLCELNRLSAHISEIQNTLDASTTEVTSSQEKLAIAVKAAEAKLIKATDGSEALPQQIVNSIAPMFKEAIDTIEVQITVFSAKVDSIDSKQSVLNESIRTYYEQTSSRLDAVEQKIATMIGSAENALSNMNEMLHTSFEQIITRFDAIDQRLTAIEESKKNTRFGLFGKR